jgi:nitrate/nitrite-specific signal transduction histidine kinase
VNKKRLCIGFAFLAAGFVAAAAALVFERENTQHPGLLAIVTVTGGVLLLVGLALSLGEIVKSVVRRLKELRQREKAIRDRRRQARQNKGNSTSQ